MADFHLEEDHPDHLEEVHPDHLEEGLRDHDVLQVLLLQDAIFHYGRYSN